MPSHELTSTAWLEDHDLLPAQHAPLVPLASWSEVKQLQAAWLAAYRRFVGNPSPENERARAVAHAAYKQAQDEALSHANAA